MAKKQIMALALHELEVYNRAMGMGERVWSIVAKWNYFAKDTVGKQLVRAADSVAANLSEGFGRFHYLENRHFCYYSRGSLSETQTWITKAHNRNLIADDEYALLQEELTHIRVKLNRYIKTIGRKN